MPVGQVDDWFCNILVKEARQWLGAIRDSSKPFFMYIASHEPHTPIDPPKSYSDMYKNARVDSLEKTIQYGHVPRTDRDISANKSEYYGTVTQLDNAFGDLMKVLDSLGLRNNTLVFFTSDNGPEDPVSLEESKGEWKDPIRDKCFGSPGIYRGMKRYVYEGGHRIPGIARFPGVIPAGTTSDKFFDGTDLFPTLCKEVGASLPERVNIDGKANFNAFLNKKIKRKVPDMWYFPCYEDTYFRLAEMEMRFGNYTLIGWLPPKPDSLSLDEWLYRNNPVKYELYDLSTDPSQQSDIASQKPRMVKRMSKTMTKLWTEMRDEGKLNRH